MKNSKLNSVCPQSLVFCHSCEGRNPEPFENTGFRLKEDRRNDREQRLVYGQTLNRSEVFNSKFLNLNSRSSRQNGFTLLEVMVALAVVGGLLLTLISTLNYQLDLVEKHETVTVATLLARNKLLEMEKSPVTEKGNFDEPFNSYLYETAVKESPYFGVTEIVVTVKSGSEEVKLNEFIFK